LMRIMPHDDAYDWVSRNTFGINAVTGAIEVVDIASVKAAVTAAPVADEKLFAGHSDKALADLGISPDVLPIVRTVSSEDQLLSLAALLPLAQGDVLLQLADGQTPEEVWATLAGPAPQIPIDVEDFDTALQRESSAAEFRAVDGPEELLDILSKPLAVWRVFLHPTQRRIAYRPSYSGPVRVTGGAGTGKTVVAMHRAKALADTLDPDQPILFTTFTKNLTRVIEQNLEMLGGKALRSRITVNNVDRIAMQIVRDAEGGKPQILSLDEEQRAWRQALEVTGSEFDPDFVQREWQQVVLAQAITTRDEYLRAPRGGRGGRLDRRQRVALWAVVEAFGTIQRQSQKRTFLQLSLEAAGYLEARTVKPFAAVIVDEAQDLHPAQWRLLRALVAPGPNDMFIAGDAYQRIYANRTTLSKVGVNVVGRAYRLRLNYRTTHDILSWATALLKGVEADDLDGAADSLDGYRSLLRGGLPSFNGAATSAVESVTMVEWVKGLVERGFGYSEIAICGRVKFTCDRMASALRASGVPFRLLEADDDSGDDAVAIGTMHRMKGLEFRAVALADCSRGSVPLPQAIVPENLDPREHARSLEIERSLVFVACTRAREVLNLSWSGQPSELLVATGALG
jgi:superfamily I DNA/RNA helicase